MCAWTVEIFIHHELNSFFRPWGSSMVLWQLCQLPILEECWQRATTVGQDHGPLQSAPDVHRLHQQGLLSQHQEGSGSRLLHAGTLLLMQSLTLTLLAANLANTKWCKKHKKWLKPWQMGTHLREFSKSYSMITNVIVLRWFPTIFVSLCFGWK